MRLFVVKRWATTRRWRVLRLYVILFRGSGAHKGWLLVDIRSATCDFECGKSVVDRALEVELLS